MKRPHLFITACLALTLGAIATHAAPTDVTVRDPSTIVKQGDTYWIFGTGRGVVQFSSSDRLHWTPRGPVFRQKPAWVETTVPGNRDSVAWAPDIAFFGGEYRLYYSYSSIGSKTSAIGLATNKTLDPDTWVDQGPVIQSGDKTPFNAIDPGIVQDADGKWWMTFGSYFQGIYLTPLDERTGKQPADAQITHLAKRPGIPVNSIEASTAIYRDGWYYLFVNWGSCLQGTRSTYNIRMGRSRAITGPYADRTGQQLLQGGGSLFLGSVIDEQTGKPFDDQVAPGHAGILREGDDYTLSTHYEWSRFQNGRTTLYVNRLAWDSDGWPRVVVDKEPFKIVSELPRHNVLEVDGEATLGLNPQTNPYEAKPGQKWTLNYQGDGYYTLVTANGLVLGSVGGSSDAGAKLELQAFQNTDAQKWYLRQNEDGSFTFLLKSSGNRLALDVIGSSNNDNAPLQLWGDNFLNPQKWTLHVR